MAVGSAVLADQAAAVAATGQAVAATEVLVVAEVADHPQPEAQVVLAAAVVVAQLAQEDVVATVAVEVVALPLGQEAPVQFFFSTHQDTNHDNLRTHHRQRSSRSN